MYDDTKDEPTPQNTAPLDNVPLNHSIPEQDGESSPKYSEDPNLHCNLAELQEHFQHLLE